ncbi:MAG: hypothetical protein ABIP48_12670 [Planctomycetota bacterium]
MRLTLAGVVLAVLSGLWTYWWWEPMYEASAWLRIRPSMLIVPGTDDTKSRIEEQAELIRSPSVLGSVVSQPEIAHLPELEQREGERPPIEWLANEIRVVQLKESEILRISFVGADPERAARIVNAVLGAYLAALDREETELTSRVIELLEEETNRRAAEVERLRANYRDLTHLGVENNPPPANSESLCKLRQSLAVTEYERTLLEIQIKALEERPLKEPDELPDAMARRPFAESPGAWAFAKQYREELARMRAQLESCHLMEKQLRERYESELKECGEEISLVMELEFTRADLEGAEQVFELIVSQIMMLRTDDLLPGSIELLKEAEIPTEPIVSFPYKRVALASMAGFCLPFVLAGLWAGFARLIRAGGNGSKTALQPEPTQ